MHTAGASEQVGEIDPVDIVIFGVVLGDPVDHHGEPALVETPEVHVVIADSVSVFGIERHGGKLGKEDRDILHGIAFRELLLLQVGEGGWSLPLTRLSRGHDDGGEVRENSVSFYANGILR